jgi:hypothetical protein
MEEDMEEDMGEEGTAQRKLNQSVDFEEFR